MISLLFVCGVLSLSDKAIFKIDECNWNFENNIENSSSDDEEKPTIKDDPISVADEGIETFKVDGREGVYTKTVSIHGSRK